MAVRISRTIVNQILLEVAREPFFEVCGLLLGDAGRIHAIRPARNTALNSREYFEIDPQTLFAQARRDRSADAGESIMIGHYHSHPNGRATPSMADAACVTDLAHYWMIVAGGAVALWQAGVEDGLHGCFARAELVID